MSIPQSGLTQSVYQPQDQIQEITFHTGLYPQSGVESDIYKGLLDHGNGCFSLSKQFTTWYKEKFRKGGTPNIQMENTYENWTGKHPLEFPEDPILDQSWHPKPIKQKLVFSYSGEWVRVPVRRGDTSGPDYIEYNIARLEKYIDIEGEVKKAVCYKKDNKDMNIWFDYEELKRALGNWTLPDTPYYYNTRRWKNKIRKKHSNPDRCSTSSPGGFWPNPRKENFFRKQAPWRRNIKKPQEFPRVYDWTSNSFSSLGGAEMTTSNRFLLLSEEDQCSNLDPPIDQIEPEDIILSPNFKKLLYTNNISDELNNDCNYYVFEKNKNFCSGYFPSFITLDDNKYNLISQNTNSDNIKDNYYLKTKNNMYLKQVVNKNSRYNLEYLSKISSGAIISQSGVAPKLLQVNNSQSRVTAHNSQSGVTAHKSQSGVTPKFPQVNNSQSGVTVLNSKSGETTQQFQHQPVKNSQSRVLSQSGGIVHNSQSGVTTHSKASRRSHLQSQQVNNSQSGVKALRDSQSRNKDYTCTKVETPCRKNADKPRKNYLII